MSDDRGVQVEGSQRRSTARPSAADAAAAASAQPRDWSVVDAREAARALGVDPDLGLSTEEADARRARSGPNELASTPPEPAWRRLVRQFADPLIGLLLAAIAISVVAGLVEGAAGVPIDAVVIALIVVANGILGFVQEAKAADAVAALQDMTAATATVLRDGRAERVPAAAIVPGDVLVLAEGDAVAADARLVASSSLQIAEASLTGESVPVTKSPAALAAPAPLGDRRNSVFKGTAVTQGVGRAVVTATGMQTEMGRIATLLSETEQEPTPLQREIRALGRTLGIAVVVIALVVMGAIGAVNGIGSLQEAVEVLLVGVSLAVAAVPEGLPAILSLVLSIGVQAMSRRGAIVKSLSSVETLGSASVICSDKTGTLTRNEMTMLTVHTGSGVADITGVGYAPEGRVLIDGSPLLESDPALELRAEDIVVLSGGTLASDAEVRQQEDGSWVVVGDPTEAAFVVAERKAGLAERRAQRFTRIGEVPFTSERKMMSVVVEDADHPLPGAERGRPVLIAKGAPDVLLERSTRRRIGMRVTELTDEDRARVLASVESMSSQALRTLAVAYRPLEPDECASVAAAGGFDSDDARALERDLIFVGTVGIIDPPRSEAADAVAAARGAGIRVVMITGDHPGTAQRIAQELGIAGPGERAVAGAGLDGMDEDALREAVRESSVFARVAPEHKLRIIGALQADGHIVAMTGDGVNDAPALKKADIGVAMGITGTEVSKEAAAMILTDDDFATIVAAVRQGRVIFGNIRKFLRYLLSSNVGEVLTMLLGVLLAGALGLAGHDGAVVVPLLATQILWINLITDSGPALAMGVDAETEDVMARPPRAPRERVIDGRMWSGIVSIGLVMAVATLLALDLHLPGGLVPGSEDVETARTAAFTTLVLAQLCNALNARSEEESAFRRMLTNRWLWAAIAFGAATQVLVVHAPLLQAAFGTAPLSLAQWLTCLALASSVLWFGELRKLALRARRRSGPRRAAA
ncbi:cation-translocating P-type ATPase [Agrococcus sp. HG114]|uniref:cation-translocating P-type ATPase n=1 Tax=Agrococcus sp. HG114 TaxID=2969757 RepID=UPI00215B09C9|nr:cation-translocating P-type ATPase [Agrococcus sp. HG114]MCR8671723.1 cation-translocating P-type ATPase [Agrococcus sp. HG114]